MSGAEMPRIEAAAAVLWCRGRVWIQKRQGTGHLDGFWEFPGGKLRSGEAPFEALLREVREEVGVELPASSVEPFERVDYRYPDRCLRLHFFLCRLKAPQPPALSSNGLWVRIDDLENYSFPPANRPILNRLQTL